MLRLPTAELKETCSRLSDLRPVPNLIPEHHPEATTYPALIKSPWCIS